MTGKELNAWRKRLGLTRREAAEALGVALATFHAYVFAPGHYRTIPEPIVKLTRMIEAEHQRRSRKGGMSKSSTP